MNLASWPGQLPYLAVFLAAAVEGEIFFVAASVLVTLGQLSALGVFVAVVRSLWLVLAAGLLRGCRAPCCDVG